MNKRIFILLGISLLLGGCGFQLRGTESNNSFALSELDLQARNRYGDTVRALKNQLISRNLQVRPGAPFQLKLVDEEINRRPVSYTSSGRTAEYQLTHRVKYEFRDQQNLLLLANQIEVQKVYVYDSSNLISSAQESALLYKEMRQDLVHQLTARLQRITPEQLTRLQENAQAKARALAVAQEASRQALNQPALPDPAPNPNPTQDALDIPPELLEHLQDLE